MNGNKEKASVHHADLWGDRDLKYNWLEKNDLTTTQWTTLQPNSSQYFFVPQSNNLQSEYFSYFEITNVFKIYSVGILTHRDQFAWDFNRENLDSKISKFLSYEYSDDEMREQLFSSKKQGKFPVGDTRDWKLSERRQSLRNDKNWQDKIFEGHYRAFDKRWIFYHKDAVEYGRWKVLTHMTQKNNISLIAQRQTYGLDFHHVFCSDKLSDLNYISNLGGGSVFPLYTYSQKQHHHNFSELFLKTIVEKLGYTPTPEAIFYYIYAVLYSPTYRDRYAEFLKIDFPRIPLTSNDELFRQLADYGEQLVQLHLMTSPKLDNLITEFVEESDRIIAPGHPKYQNGAVQINKSGDKFTGVPEEVWNFYVGGYQPCQKWLKDRKERTLSDEDILHYQKMIVSLKETIELMTKIDEAIPGFPID
jgi:predicted helicase